MAFLFKSIKRAHAKPSMCIRPTPGITSGQEDVPILGASRSKSRKLLTRSRRSQASASDDTNIGTQAGDFNVSGSYSSRSSSRSTRSRSSTRGLADLTFDPDKHTGMCPQASAERITNEGSGTSNWNLSGKPETPSPSHSRDASLPPVPPCMPDSSLARSLNTSSSSESGGCADPVVGGITYDAILASTLSRGLGLVKDVPSETKAPPNSPANSSPRRGFGSLLGLSLAIMEGKGQVSSVC